MQSTELSAMADRTPTSIGRYQVVCRLGTGGMANVYLAHQPGPFSAGKLLVIKHLKPCFSNDEEFVQMFANESRIAVRLNHPNVVHTYEVAAEGDDYYLALEFLNGKNLRQIQQSSASPGMPLDLQLWVLGQVLAGLHYAHELKDFDDSALGIIHRDVSPTNVFITYDGEVKLLDFGIAKSLGAMSATREGVVKGKLGYASPEQCRCGPIDRRTDVYSVGVMLWEAVAGQKRARGETEASILQARIRGLETSLAEECPNAPPGLVAICDKALRPRPEDRYQTAQEMQQAVERFLGGRAKAAGESLARFMRSQFSDDIGQMQRCLSGYMGQPRALPSSEPCGNTGVGQARSLTGVSQSGMSGVVVTAGRVLPEPSEASIHLLRHPDSSYPVDPSGLTFSYATPWYRQGRLLMTLGIGAISLVALTAWLVSPRAVVIQSTPLPAVSPAVVVRSAALPAPDQAPSASGQVQVSLSAFPSGVVMRLDGRRISNPYNAVHGSDRIPHHVSVTLSGYEAVEEDLAFDRAVTKSYKLVPGPTASGGGRWRATAGRGRTPSAPQAPETSNTSARQIPEPPQPGEDLGGIQGRSPIPDLEEKDPYK